MPRLAANLFFISAFAWVTLLSSPAFANKTVGTLMVVKGKVWIVDAKGKKSRARVGSKIKTQDTVVTEKDSRAKLVMLDKNEINVSPDSEINLEKYEFDPKSDKKDVLLNVIYGKVRSNVQQKYDGDKSKFQVKTKAAVAGVRGTDFLSGYNRTTQKSEFVTFSGMVEIGKVGLNGAIVNPVRLSPGQITSASLTGGVSPPQQLSKNALANMNNESFGGGDNDRTPSNDDRGKRDESGKGPDDGQGPGENPGGPNSMLDPGSDSELQGDLTLPRDRDPANDGGPKLDPTGRPEPPLVHRDPCAINPLAPGCGSNYPPPPIDQICPTCKDLQQGNTKLIIDIINQ